MKLLIAVFLSIYTAACGVQNHVSITNSFVRTKSPGWIPLNKVSNPFEQNLFKNVFRLSIGNGLIGTGFLISASSKYLVTNAHVAILWRVKCRFITCPAAIGENKIANIKLVEIEFIDKELDFALISIVWAKTTDPVRQLDIANNNSKENESIYVIGFSKYENSFVSSSGIIKDLDIAGDYKPSILYSADTEAGMSGSPLFNSKYELIGIHYGTKNGVNRAIPITLIAAKYPDIFPF